MKGMIGWNLVQTSNSTYGHTICMQQHTYGLLYNPCYQGIYEL